MQASFFIRNLCCRFKIFKLKAVVLDVIVPSWQVPHAFGFWRFGLLGGEGRVFGFKHRQNPVHGLLPDFRYQLTSLGDASFFQWLWSITENWWIFTLNLLKDRLVVERLQAALFPWKHELHWAQKGIWSPSPCYRWAPTLCDVLPHKLQVHWRVGGYLPKDSNGDSLVVVMIYRSVLPLRIHLCLCGKWEKPLAKYLFSRHRNRSHNPQNGDLSSPLSCPPWNRILSLLNCPNIQSTIHIIYWSQDHGSWAYKDAWSLPNISTWNCPF